MFTERLIQTPLKQQVCRGRGITVNYTFSVFCESENVHSVANAKPLFHSVWQIWNYIYRDRWLHTLNQNKADKNRCFANLSAFFTDFVKKLKTVLRKLVSKDIIWFGNGTARGFDLLAAQTVLEMKQEYPQIRLILVLPCKDQTAKWYDKAEIALYNDILKQADKVVYLHEHYTDGCMLERNRYLVDNSRYCVCYLNNNVGGTAYTVKYAERQKLIVYSIKKQLWSLLNV